MIAWYWLLVAGAVCFGLGVVLAFGLAALCRTADDRDEATVDDEGWGQ